MSIQPQIDFQIFAICVGLHISGGFEPVENVNRASHDGSRMCDLAELFKRMHGDVFFHGWNYLRASPTGTLAGGTLKLRSRS